MTLADALKSANAALTVEQTLRSPTDVLQGVSSSARATLDAIDIHTVFDLAASSVFATAMALTAAETDATTLETRLNGAAADAVNPPPGLAVSQWSRQGLSILAGLDPADVTALETELGVGTVRDLAHWPPFATAKSILNEALGGTSAPGSDGATPADLLPKSGVYPTERVLFTKLLIDLVPQPAQSITPLEQAGAVDLGSALSAPTAFQQLATGALVTLRQSWYSEGVTLAQLLHSLTLAPGECTRIAMLDWSRQVGASVTEQIDENEQLASTQLHNRALTEVTNASAIEFQSGSSTTHVDSTSTQGGAALGVDLGVFAFGGSASGGSTETTSMSASSSFGARDLAASLAQNVNDRTQQNASLARSRRASVVVEVSQDESNAITARALCNYNHMHALNVQYFELVQAYRVTTELDRVERCLFVPLALLDFHDGALVARLASTLAAAALTSTAFRQLTTEYGAVEIAPKTPRIRPGEIIIQPDPVGGVVMGRLAAPASGQPGTTPVDSSDVPLTLNERVLDGPPTADITVATAKGWDPQQIIRLGSITSGVPLRRGSDSVFVPDDAQLLSIFLRDGAAAQFQIRKRDNSDVPGTAGSPTSFVLAAPAPFADLQTIALQSAVDEDVATSLALNLTINSSTVTLDVPIRFRDRAAVPGLQDVIGFGTVGPSPELIEHLEANRLHYSRAVYGTLDQATIAGILAGYTYRDAPLTQVVDPQPIAVTANFLVFRTNVPRDGDPDDPAFVAEQQDFRTFLATRGLDKSVPRSEIVPLPTGGVFAEAVLGRYNSAEKIELDRFWNWQDSPIPESAPEIATLSAGSRAEVENTKPGQLGSPILTPQTPTALPAGAGVGAILAALQQANMFRDMSGMAQTAALAQAAVATSGAGATSAAEQAAKNLQTVMDQNTQRMRVAADLIAATSKKGSKDDKVTATEQAGQRRAAEEIGKQDSASDGRAHGGPTRSDGGSSTNGGSLGGATPPSLQKETLDQQTGTAATAVVDKIVDAATEPDIGNAAPSPNRPKPKPKRKPKPPNGSSADPDDIPDDSPAAAKHYRLTVYFEESANVDLPADRTIQLSRLAVSTGADVISFSHITGGAETIDFNLPSVMDTVSIEVTATDPSKNVRLRHSKVLKLPSVFNVATVELEVHVKPVIGWVTFFVPDNGQGQFDRAHADTQIGNSGIPKDMFVEPYAVTAIGTNLLWKVRARYYRPELIVKQVL